MTDTIKSLKARTTHVLNSIVTPSRIGLLGDEWEFSQNRRQEYIENRKYLEQELRGWEEWADNAIAAQDSSLVTVELLSKWSNTIDKLVELHENEATEIQLQFENQLKGDKSELSQKQDALNETARSLDSVIQKIAEVEAGLSDVESTVSNLLKIKDYAGKAMSKVPSKKGLTKALAQKSVEEQIEKQLATVIDLQKTKEIQLVLLSSGEYTSLRSVFMNFWNASYAVNEVKEKIQNNEEGIANTKLTLFSSKIENVLETVFSNETKHTVDEKEPSDSASGHDNEDSRETGETDPEEPSDSASGHDNEDSRETCETDPEEPSDSASGHEEEPPEPPPVAG